MNVPPEASKSPELGRLIANLPSANGIHGRAMTTVSSTVRARSSAPAAPRTVLCPVCLEGVETDSRGVIRPHHGCPMGGRPVPAWDEDSTRSAVRGRSDGICEYCQQARAQDMAHRRASGVGGRWSPANILHLCRRCHRRAHDYPHWAHALGLRLKEGEDPEKRPVTREDASWFQPSDEVAMPIPKGGKR
jgi:5-methylcytosine-specific restriction endonuclease McrA